MISSEKINNLHQTHTIWGGIDIKITDILIIGANLVVFSVMILFWIFNFITRKRKSNEVITLGPLSNLGIVYAKKKN